MPRPRANVKAKPKPKPDPAPPVALPPKRAPRQRLAAGVPGEVIPIAIPPLFTWQQRVREAMQTHRFVVVSSARQIGKSFAATLFALDVAMNGGEVWWIAPNFHLTKPGYDTLVKIMRQPPFNKIMTLEKQRRLFTIKNGGKIGTIEVVSADDPETVVGATLDLVVIDEAARMHPDAWYEGAYSTLTVRRGRALLISNPRGRNWFWELWRRGDPTAPEYDPDYASFEFSQYDNPMVSHEDIDRQRRQMPPLKFQREVMGKFIDDGGEVFLGVRRAAIVDPHPIPPRAPIPGHDYYFGMDISPGRHDFSVIMVFDKTDMQFVAMYRFSEPELPKQVDILTRAYQYWRPRRVLVEENNAGLFALQFFQGAGVPVEAFNTNWQTKPELIQKYSAAVELGQIRLLRDDEVIKEHEAYESEVSASGQIKYSAPRGGHDDIVMASAITYRAAFEEAAAAAPPIFITSHHLYGRQRASRAKWNGRL